jgi:hypothetical protein
MAGQKAMNNNSGGLICMMVAWPLIRITEEGLIIKIMAQEVHKEMLEETGIKGVSLMAVTDPRGILIEGKNIAMRVAA